MKKIFFLLVFLPVFLFSQQSISTLQKAPGLGYTIWTKSTGTQQYMLFTTALDTSGIYDYIDSLFNTVSGQNGIISALPLGSVNIEALPGASFQIDSLNLYQVQSRSNSGTAQSRYFQSASASLPTIIEVVSPTDTNLIAKILLDSDGQSSFISNDLALRTKNASGQINFFLNAFSSANPYITVFDSTGFGVKFYDKYQLPNDTPTDGDVLIFYADGHSEFSAFPSGVNIYNSDGVQTDAIRNYDGDGGTLEFVNMLDMDLNGSGRIRMRSNNNGVSVGGGTYSILLNIAQNLPAQVVDNRTTKTGLQYAADYCSTLTTRSLIDKGCAQSLINATTLWGMKADAGTSQDVVTGDQVELRGGYGINTRVGATDLWTVEVDTAQIATQYDLSQVGNNIYTGDGTITDANRTVTILDALKFVIGTQGVNINAGNGNVVIGDTGSGQGDIIFNWDTNDYLQLNGRSSTTAGLRLAEAPTNGNNYLELRPSAAMSANYTLTFPASNGAGNLQNDGSGNLSWASAGGTVISQSYNTTTNAGGNVNITLPGVPTNGNCTCSNKSNTTNREMIYSIVYTGGTSATVSVWASDLAIPCQNCSVNFQVICH